MKTIIVPVDFSAAAANAAEYAGNLALFYGADIWLYHAYEAPIALSEFAYPVFDVNEMQKAAEYELEKMQEHIQHKLRSPVTIHLHAEMSVFEIGLKAFTADKKADLVVMGLSGKSSLTRLIVGSNTIKAVYTLDCPLLVVPPKALFEPVYRLGFACDYQKIEHKHPLDLLKKVVHDFKSELHILNIDFNQQFTPDMVNQSMLIFDYLVDEKPIYHNIEANDIISGVNKFAEKTSVNWIAVMPRKSSLIGQLFNRSHTQELLFHASLPVLCIHE
jgi:nucleotide-binding universal stress UspA family protein